MPAPRTGAGARRKRGRLSRSGDFDRVYRQGRSTGGREFVVHVFPREASLDPPRVGLSVSKKVGDAVTRNRIKRVLREAVAELEADLAAGSDLVITARADSVDLDEREGKAGVERELRALLQRTSAWAGGDPAAPGATQSTAPATATDDEQADG
ncbi:MAG: ribonuclease P protein component [Solirubrobacteraceae bacterium]|nr:ribonuclease P protein component [Solirubrobacteraceae bacterium]